MYVGHSTAGISILSVQDGTGLKDNEGATPHAAPALLKPTREDRNPYTKLVITAVIRYRAIGPEEYTGVITSVALASTRGIVILLGTRAEVQLVLQVYVPISTVLLYLTTHLGVRGGILQIIDDCRVLRRGLNSKW